jgi:hypothetical protein
MYSFMTAPRTVTLFAEHADSRPPVSIAVSALVHVGIVSLVGFGVLYNPPVITNAPLDKYSLRRLDLHIPDTEGRREVADATPKPAPQHVNHSAPSGGKEAAQARVTPPFQKTKIGPQTILQPDLHTNMAMLQAPVPQVVLWTPTKTPVVKIVPPPPQKLPSAQVKPTLAPPVVEPNLSDMSIASVPRPSIKPMVLAGTTTPVAVQAPPKPATTPSSVSQTTAPPTAATVMSLSDVRMKNGTVALPPVNQVVAATAPGLASGPAKSSSAPGNGNTETKSSGSGDGSGKSSGAHAGDGPESASNTPSGAGTGSKSTVPGSGHGEGLSSTLIALPSDGHFSSVIVGSSLQDQYPEITDVWRGRMAYTVYLHVGLEKSWILQYSLPRAADATSAGTVAHLDAPWPYSIVRPNLMPGSLDSDALMVHGYVNNAGHFETLSIVFPERFPEAQFVLESLARWQFRPASENGQLAKVEVLLIIPEQFE